MARWGNLHANGVRLIEPGVSCRSDGEDAIPRDSEHNDLLQRRSRALDSGCRIGSREAVEEGLIADAGFGQEGVEGHERVGSQFVEFT